ncbi:alkaline phosphatase family protein [Intrasporangium sp. YIM S08009]|uniref:alkaline phosphatase family protein n=1 Tax=Intrasporangium zincisolvens TaxID=3080018 RepID=UPI002B05618E|nr:alkaline phosphatase family protein [Intrasporangium sp. YIM S08009]
MAPLAAAVVCAPAGSASTQLNPKVEHVLLLSLDGFHDADLTNYAAAHPSSALASVLARGRRYSNASAQTPSDSFPATLAMTTGGSPRSTGVYYDVSWDNDLSPAGSDCSTRGALVPFNQSINVNPNAGDSVADINPAKLPRDPDRGCSVVYPHQFLKVNTIYEVAHAAGLRTAVADKHPSYEILAGPSGTGIDDFYGPEFNAAKSDVAKIMANDELKVGAVLNQIDGYTHDRTAAVGVPAIFGMNFQAANIGQKFSGYVDAAGTTPQSTTTIGPLAGTAPGLAQALDYVDGAVGRMLGRIEADGLTDDTMVILTAKHANSPVDRSTLRWVDPAGFAPLVNSVQPGLTAQVTADTMALVWLKDRSRAADAAAVLEANAATIGAGTVTSGAAVGELFDGQLGGNAGRIPDIVVQPATGVVYAAPNAKLVDHGSGSAEDTHVPLVIIEPGRKGGRTLSCPVSLRQVAPTVLRALGLKESLLDAVRLEGTQRLTNGDEC